MPITQLIAYSLSADTLLSGYLQLEQAPGLHHKTIQTERWRVCAILECFHMDTIGLHELYRILHLPRLIQSCSNADLLADQLATYPGIYSIYPSDHRLFCIPSDRELASLRYFYTTLGRCTVANYLQQSINMTIEQGLHYGWPLLDTLFEQEGMGSTHPNHWVLDLFH